MSISFIVSFALSIIAMPFFIRFMHEKQFGQEIREEGPSWHRKKSGTPTMGGVVFLSAVVVALLLHAIISRNFHQDIFLLILSLILYGLIGFSDDFLKIFRHQNEGLTSKQKFLLQILMAVILFALLVAFRGESTLPTRDNGFLQFILRFAVLIFFIFWVVGFSNAFNLTDGIDGLSSGCGIISYTAYLFIALRQGETEVAVFCAAVVGALFGFIVYNVKPAKIFMGDVGSLALGAGLAVLSFRLENPWSLLIIGIIYVIETSSVILQVLVFQKTGQRVFKMTPIHHHFEMCGWSEWKIDFVFWGICLAGAIIGYLVF